MLTQNYKLIFFHLIIITLSNYLVQFPLNFLDFISTWGMFTFPFLVLASDLTVRLKGKKSARYVVLFSYLPCLLISMILNSQRIALASATAYLVGQILDIFIFDIIRKKYSLWWLSPFISTTVSNVVDTYLFFAVAFYACEDSFMNKNWLSIAHNDLLFKIIISTLFFLPAYGFTLGLLLDRKRP